MTLQEFKEAQKFAQLIEAKRKEVRLFENGKIMGLSVRLFNEDKIVYEDKEYTNQLPNAKLKGVMLDHLKNELQSLEFRFEKLFNVQNSFSTIEKN